jgi:hypothetical protein
MSTSSTESTSKQVMMHHTLLPQINISTESASDYLKNAVVIFPENGFSEEPTSLGEELSFSLMTKCPSPIERKVDRYRKLRAMRERAGRLPKSTENNSN